MSLVSMTGFGAGSATGKGWRVAVELSAVNRKQFDIRISLPRDLAALEADISNTVHKRVVRGNVNAVVQVARTEAVPRGKALVDEALARHYLSALRNVARKLDIADDIGIRDLAVLPEVVHYQTAEVNPALVRPLLMKALQQALNGLCRMRGIEGATIHKDIKSRLERLERLAGRIGKRAAGHPARVRKRLAARIAEAGINDAKSDPSFIREITYMAERADISEELVRLESHLQQAHLLLRKTEPVGRALDFLCQELFREINTIGSKAADPAILRDVIAFKTLLETVREQVQNVE